MSNVNIKRTVENIKAYTTIYTPIVEVVVNAIQAIQSKGSKDGNVEICIHRSKQLTFEGGLPDIQSFEIKDNGIGFNDENRDAFDTLYTDNKISEGGKGFGRFTCLRYFNDVRIDSIYLDSNGKFKKRKFLMGKSNDIIEDEEISDTLEQDTRTTIHLCNLNDGKNIDKKLKTVARNIVEKLLPYFIDESFNCPDIILSEDDGSQHMRLNDFVNDKDCADIIEIPVTHYNFDLIGLNNTNESFYVRVFKILYPKAQKSKISLVAHRREVSGSPLSKYIPEFNDEFFEKDSKGESIVSKNYIVKAYVFGSYLDRNVSLERSGFEFSMERDLQHGISQVDIEQVTSQIAKDAVGMDIHARQEKKKERVQSYVNDEAPWHKSLLATIDLTEMPYRPTPEEIEIRLQKEKYARELQIKQDVKTLLTDSYFDRKQYSIQDIVSKISDTGKNDLIHYIALRRYILHIFDKSLQSDKNGNYFCEGTVHDIIFPRKGDSDTTPFEDHNLWLIDERLNFTNYIASDKTLNGPNTERPDLIIFDKPISFRGDNEASNPIIIFEFKKPQRDDFVNPSSKDDPVDQIIRYVNDISDGKYRTPEGRNIIVSENTPFYGYVVCDITPKVETWLKRQKDFKPMPDRLGWFQWRDINLYIEVISWEKVLKDATMRSKIFFHKLGI